MLLQTTPLPPLPEPSVLNPGNVDTIVIGLTLMVASIAAVFLLKPLILAWARRIEGRGADATLHAEVEQVREQLAEVDPLRQRVLELEERMEFTERMLAQRRDPAGLPRGGADA